MNGFGSELCITNKLHGIVCYFNCASVEFAWYVVCMNNCMNRSGHVEHFHFSLVHLSSGHAFFISHYR